MKKNRQDKKGSSFRDHEQATQGLPL
jgi:hypothetical protein